MQVFFREFLVFVLFYVVNFLYYVGEVKLYEELSFGSRFQQALRLRGLKQTDISSRTGIAPGTISNYALGKYAPRPDKLEAIASALGVSVSYLAGYTDDPNPTGDPGLDSFLDTFTRMTQPGSFGSVSVSADELKMILAFREADPAIQSAVRKLLDLGGDR